MNRRYLLKLGIASAASLALPFSACSVFGGEEQVGEVLPSEATLPEPFGVRLPVPPVLNPVRRDSDTDYYEITQRERTAEILPGLSTTIWGYNGIFPGPTIEARSGRQVVVRLRNELPVPTVTHLHGGVTPSESDGYPIDLVLPVDSSAGDFRNGHGSGLISEGERDYVYPLQQRAATLWYHDHRMDFTGPQVYRGLAGFLIIRDDEDDALPLPTGDKDIPLMIADRSFGADGSFLYPSRDASLEDEPGVENDFVEGVLGDTILVNGAPWPYLDVATTLYRFRMLNASNARRYEIELDPAPQDGSAFIQVGSDGGLLSKPVTHEHLAISPAERFDLVIDFSQYAVGDTVTLKDRLGDGPTEQVMQFRVTRDERDDSSVPDELAEIEQLDPDDAVETRRLRFHRGDVSGRRGWVINDDPFSPNTINANPRLNDVEIWELRGNTHHPIHVHLVHFQVLSRDGNSPDTRDAGWKDTVNLDAGEEVRVIARFSGYRGKYVFHCHNLEHEDMAMMGNFEVV